MSRRRVRIAAAAYPVTRPATAAEAAQKREAWVADAARSGAEILVFPEYAGMELAGLLPDALAADPDAQIDAVSDLAAEAEAHWAALAARYGVHILGGSACRRRDDGAAVNRAVFAGPSGAVGVQDKLILTPWERSGWPGLSAGESLTLFETPLGVVGVLICYDSEFPLLARRLAAAGAEILLVPSCTEAAQGYWRVRIAAQARALEAQCVAAQAPLVGAAPWSGVIDMNRGAAGVFTPPDGAFPDDGVAALGGMDAPGWVTADVDLDALAELRAGGGAVAGAAHWPEQERSLPVRRERL